MKMVATKEVMAGWLDNANFRITTDYVFELVNVSNQMFYPIWASGTYKAVTQLEWVASDGNQYVDTGVILDAQSRFSVTGQYISLPDSGETKIGGTGATLTLAVSIGRCVAPNRVGEYCFATSGTFSPAVPRQNLMTNKHTWEFDLSTGVYTITPNNGSTSTFKFTVPNVYVAGNSVTFFKENSLGYPYPSNTKIFEATFWKNDNIVSHLLPALDSDGKPCFYDVVSGQYHYNSGTGELTYGDKAGDIVLEAVTIAVSDTPDDTSERLDFGMDAFPTGGANGNYRINDDNVFQLRNATTQLYHTVYIGGTASQPTLSVEQQGEE